jgi:hypothetical protein
LPFALVYAFVKLSNTVSLSSLLIGINAPLYV